MRSVFPFIVMPSPINLKRVGVLAVLASLFAALAAPTSMQAEEQGIASGTAENLVDENHPIEFNSAGDGGGQRVIFVHGTPGDAGAWDEYLVGVPNGFEYLAIHRPGFGETGGPAMTGLADQAKALLTLLYDENSPACPTCTASKPILVGHSLGGPIVARAAVDFPGKIGGIIIVAGSLDPALEKIHPLQPIGEWWPIRVLLPSAIRNSNRELLALKPELEALEKQLGSVLTRTVIVHGTDDGLVPFSNVAFMQAKFQPDTIVETIIIEGGNHFLPWNSKDEIDEAINLVADRLD